MIRKSYLSHFTRIAVNEESFGSGQFTDHSLSQEVEDNKERHQFSLFHHFIQLLATIASAFDFILKIDEISMIDFLHFIQLLSLI